MLGNSRCPVVEAPEKFSSICSSDRDSIIIRVIETMKPEKIIGIP